MTIVGSDGFAATSVIFIAVAEDLHFGKAAQRLHISQPSLSLAIKSMEEDLGVRLFERNRHKVKLSVAGEAALSEAYRTLDQAARVRSSALQAERGQVAKLSIGCVQSAFFAVLPPIVNQLHVLHPEIALSVTDVETAAAIPAMLEGRLDVGIFRLEHAEAPLKLKTLMSDYFIAAVPEHHPLARRKYIPLRALAGELLITFERQIFPRSHEVIVAACEKAGFHPNVAYQSRSIQTQVGLVACALGVAILPSYVREWRVPRVVYRDLATGDFTRTAWQSFGTQTARPQQWMRF